MPFLWTGRDKAKQELVCRIHPFGDFTEILIVTLQDGRREIIFLDGDWLTEGPASNDPHDNK